MLHDAARRIGPARWKHRAWVCCALSFRDRHRDIMPPRRWTALFFLDEAVALAAGHRPCGECRRTAYRAFAEAWARAEGRWPGPKAADAALHAARALPGARALRRHRRVAADLPEGAMAAWDGRAHLLLADRALPYAPDGYAAAVDRPRGEVTVLTNARALAVLAAGYRPSLHPSAGT